MSLSITSIRHKLLKPTSFFGIKLWIAIVICIALIILLVFSLTICFIVRRRRRDSLCIRTKSITSSKSMSSMNRRLLSRNGWDVEMSIATPEKQVMYSDQRPANGIESAAKYPPVCWDHIGPSYEYTLEEIETATNGFADENLIGSGDHGVVYYGIFSDNNRVAVKKLLVNSGRSRDFTKEVEAMLCIRHKNLVKLLGFCTEGMYRILVYEYVDNGNLKQWLHESICKMSPLTWNIRMSIISGIAKGLAYLHEDSEPAILHQHLKSGNILLDKQWNPKTSDFGISNFLGPEWNHIIASPMGMSGYIAPEYADTAVLDVKSDVYSFGILIMEIISGRASVQKSATEIEEYLIDWIKLMVANQKFDEVVDPKLPEMPPLKELKRILLIALRCVDPEANNRPKMGDVIHMLEPRDLLLSDEHVLKRVTSRRNSCKNDQETAE